jgi:hypothetical protein
MSHPARTLAPALVAIVLALLAAAPAHAANWTCEASAVRGTVLGAATIEPLTANKGQSTCQPARAGLNGLTAALPLPLSADLLGAQTTVVNADQPVARHQVGAAGGIADLHVRALPELPIQVPMPNLDQFSAVDAGIVKVDLRQALQNLLPNGRLPNADLLRLQAIVAYAGGQCVDGRVQLTGSSQVAGISVLGQELPVNEAVERTVSLVDSTSIDPSNVDMDDVKIVEGVVLSPSALEPVLRPILDAMPPIAIPAALATVRVTPGQQVREGDRLIQRALQVQVTVLGQQLADLLIGEASVGAQDIACTEGPASAAESALQCTTRRLVLADVVPGRRRVRLLGYADKRYIGRTVDIHFIADGRRVARARVRRDGSFRTTAPMPPRAIRHSDRARYQARLGRERSMRLKLMRRMQVLSVRTSGRRVTIVGRVVEPLARPVQPIEVRRRISCSRWRVVRRIRPSKSGRFRTTIAGPPSQLAATYRLATRVRSSARGDSDKTFETFTLPRFVDLG